MPWQPHTLFVHQAAADSSSDDGRSDRSPQSDVASQVSPGDIDEDRFSDFSELGDDEFDATVGVAPASGSDDPVPPFVAGGASSSSAAVFPSVAACQVCEDPELGSAAGSVALFCPDGSKIVYYRSDGRFEATCGNIKHGKRCRLTRTSKPPDGGLLPVPGQGGPLGLLLAWLLGCKLSQCKHPWQHLTYIPDFEYRRKCRNRLLKSDNPIILALLKAERKPFEGEGLEPVVSE